MSKILENTIIKSGVKAIKYPAFAAALPVIFELLEKFAEIQIIIPGLDKLATTGVLFTVAGFIFVYDVLKHGFGLKLW